MPVKKKKNSKTSKVRDLKPSKDAKGGFRRPQASSTHTNFISHRLQGGTRQG
jgi:hypothetical protein